jgi:hypothetical protein
VLSRGVGADSDPGCGPRPVLFLPRHPHSRRSRGDIYTVAGTGTPEFADDGGPATSAALLIPEGLAVDAAGNLVIAGSGNNRIRTMKG